MSQDVHRAIAEGLAEELNAALGHEWFAEPKQHEKRWTVLALPRLARAWPQVEITLREEEVTWRGFWSVPEQHPIELEGGDKVVIVSQNGKADGPLKLTYDDPSLVPELIRRTVEWMTRHQDCTVSPLPPGTRPPTVRERVNEWLQNSAGAAHFEAPDLIPPMLLFRDAIPNRRHVDE